MAQVRQDLLALTPAAIASLANMGLLKRAQKDLDEGHAPTLALADDGALTASWADGAIARLIPGKALKDCPCSCGASAVCRHRVGAILAYQRAAAPTAAQPAGAPKPPTSWSPAEIRCSRQATAVRCAPGPVAPWARCCRGTRPL